MIAHYSKERSSGRTFGFHKTLDIGGELSGTLILLGLFYFLGESENMIRNIFFATLVPGLIGLFIVLFFVKDVPRKKVEKSKRFVLTKRDRSTIRSLFFYFFFLLFIFSDAFFTMQAKDVGIATVMIPLLFVVSTGVQTLTSYLFGVWIDRVGAEKILAFAYLCGLLRLFGSVYRSLAECEPLSYRPKSRQPRFRIWGLLRLNRTFRSGGSLYLRNDLGAFRYAFGSSFRTCGHFVHGSSIPRFKKPVQKTSGFAMAELEIKDVTVKHRNITAIEGACLNAERGEIVGLIGADEGIGLVLYKNLTVSEHLSFFSKIRGLKEDAALDRYRKRLLKMAGLERFTDRPAGKLSGGMMQKLSLICTLIHRPSLLFLDEPTTGVDPLSRLELWDILNEIRADEGTVILMSTAYMQEAAKMDRVYLFDSGTIIASGTAEELAETVKEYVYDPVPCKSERCLSTGNYTYSLDPLEAPRKKPTLEALFFINALKRGAEIPEIVVSERESVEPIPRVVMEAKGLTKRFGDFIADDHIDMELKSGEILGLLGANGAGKTTFIKMLLGLYPIDDGELTLLLGFESYMDSLPTELPLGINQRFSVAAALLHEPVVLFLDEPTSGVDAIARSRFWQMLKLLKQKWGIAILITTHYMSEAEYCDRVVLLKEGKKVSLYSKRVQGARPFTSHSYCLHPAYNDNHTFRLRHTHGSHRCQNAYNRQRQQQDFT